MSSADMPASSSGSAALSNTVREDRTYKGPTGPVHALRGINLQIAAAQDGLGTPLRIVGKWEQI